MLEFTREKHIRLIQYLDRIESMYELPKTAHWMEYMDANTLNLDLNTPIYRIFQWDKFMDLMNNNRLCLVKPSLWDDPFENFLLKAKGIRENGETIEFDNIRNLLYGACWTLKDECDGLWRNYTNYECKKCSLCDWRKRHGGTNVSIKVKTTVGKLMSAFYDFNNPFHSLSYWIGKVEYLSDQDIIGVLDKCGDRLLDDTGVNLIRTLLIKRKAFEYEQEVRVIFMKPDNSNETDFSKLKNTWNDGDLFFVSVNPNEIINEVEFDPWIAPSILHDKEKELKSLYQGPIKKSGLYNQPYFQISMP